MSDVTVAPSGGAPTAAPTPSSPATNEVVVNQNPTNIPNPVGPQAPEKPTGEVEGSKHRPQSRQETIRAAFERATKQQDEGEKRAPQRREAAKETPPAADAKKGHNNPPEETQQEKPQQHREGGRFARAPDAQQQPQPQPAPGQAPQQPNGQQQPQPAQGNYREPPRRFSDLSKQDWAKTPESVRADVYRTMQEFDGAYRRYRGDHEAMNAIRPFHEMATQQGTNLHTALNNYVSMEMKLREDVVGGLDIIIRNLGLKGPDGAPITLQDVAYHILNMSPDQHRLTQAQNATSAQRQQIGQLHQKIEGLENTLKQMHNAQRFNQSRAYVEQFAETHPRFEELGDLIQNEIDLGFNLEQAYRRAELLRPATHAAQTRTTSAQTRQPDRSISGAPTSGPSNGRSERKPSPNRRAAIANAIQSVTGAGI